MFVTNSIGMAGKVDWQRRNAVDGGGCQKQVALDLGHMVGRMIRAQTQAGAENVTGMMSRTGT